MRHFGAEPRRREREHRRLLEELERRRKLDPREISEPAATPVGVEIPCSSDTREVKSHFRSGLR